MLNLFYLSQIIWSDRDFGLVDLTFNALESNFHMQQFFGYAAILQPALNSKSFSRKLSDPNLVNKNKLFKGPSYFTYPTCAAFSASVSDVIDANKLIALLK